uniref:ABC transmembrane type-1 domain-containing protein n=1 Tax=Echinococcus granulosus TaxID=6210 RepID=A0A068WWZ1_ECHGR|nr:hypothetical protein EgrG_000915500 [Echinococcus granulosus]
MYRSHTSQDQTTLSLVQSGINASTTAFTRFVIATPVIETVVRSPQCMSLFNKSKSMLAQIAQWWWLGQ